MFVVFYFQDFTTFLLKFVSVIKMPFQHFDHKFHNGKSNPALKLVSHLMGCPKIFW